MEKRKAIAYVVCVLKREEVQEDGSVKEMLGAVEDKIESGMNITYHFKCFSKDLEYVHMCATKKESEEVARAWNKTWISQGRYYWSRRA